MKEIWVIQNFEGTWELWVNQTCVATEFVTKDAAWNYVDRYLAYFNKGSEGRVKATRATQRGPTQEGAEMANAN